jgi:hypothetical protein
VIGVVLMILGTVFHVAADLSKVPESRAPDPDWTFAIAAGGCRDIARGDEGLVRLGRGEAAVRSPGDARRHSR